MRLTRGNYDECKTYYNDPVEAARYFEDMGMRRLHLVDLDGARESRVINWRVLERICEATRLEVDFSGGVKSDEDICRVFDVGASFVCIGSMAQQNREKTREWLERYGTERVIVGADVRDGSNPFSMLPEPLVFPVRLFTVTLSPAKTHPMPCLLYTSQPHKFVVKPQRGRIGKRKI